MDELILTPDHVSRSKPICCSSHAEAVKRGQKQEREKKLLESNYIPPIRKDVATKFDNLTSAVSAAGIRGRKIGGGVGILLSGLCWGQE